MIFNRFKLIKLKPLLSKTAVVLALSISLALPLGISGNHVLAASSLFSGITSVEIKPSHGKLQTLKMQSDLPFEYQVQVLNNNQVLVRLLRARLSDQLIAESGVLNVAPKGWIESATLHVASDPENEEIILAGPGLGSKQIMIEGATLIATPKAPRPAVRIVTDKDIPELPADVLQAENDLARTKPTTILKASSKPLKTAPKQEAAQTGKPLIRLQKPAFNPDTVGTPKQTAADNQAKNLMAIEVPEKRVPEKKLASPSKDVIKPLVKMPNWGFPAASDPNPKPTPQLTNRKSADKPVASKTTRPSITTIQQKRYQSSTHPAATLVNTDPKDFQKGRLAVDLDVLSPRNHVLSKPAHRETDYTPIETPSARSAPKQTEREQDKLMVYFPPASDLYNRPAQVVKLPDNYQPPQYQATYQTQPVTSQAVPPMTMAAIAEPSQPVYDNTRRGPQVAQIYDTGSFRSIRSDQVYQGPQYEAAPAYPYQPQQNQPQQTQEPEQAAIEFTPLIQNNGVMVTQALPRYTGGNAPMSYTVSSGQGARDQIVYTLPPGFSVPTNTLNTNGDLPAINTLAMATPASVNEKMQQALSAFKANRLDEAKAELTAAVSLNPKEPKLFAALGEIHLKNKNWREAQSAYQQAHQLAPGSYALRYAEASVLAGNRNLAIEILSNYLKAPTQDVAAFGKAHYMLGTLYEGLGDSEQALPHLQQAAQLTPGDADVQYNLGLAYELIGNAMLAKVHYGKAVQLNPKAQDAQNALSRTRAL